MSEELLVFSRRLSVSQIGQVDLINGEWYTIRPGICCICGNAIDPKFDSGIAIGSRCEECYRKKRPAFIPGDNIRLVSCGTPTRWNDLTIPGIVVEILVDGRWLEASEPDSDKVVFLEALSEKPRNPERQIPFFALIGAWELTRMIRKGELVTKTRHDLNDRKSRCQYSLP